MQVVSTQTACVYRFVYMEMLMVNEFERMDCIYVYSCVWMYINAVFLLCTCTRLLCGDTLVHIYCGYIYVGQSKLRAHFISSLHIVAIQKHQNWRSVCNGRATMTASGQHSHRLHADEMKSTCCRLCLHWRHPLCGRQHIETQSRETQRRIKAKQPGKTARIQCERMKWVVRGACKNAGMQACRYNAGMRVRNVVDSRFRLSHTHILTSSYFCWLIRFVSLHYLTNTAHGQGEVRVVGYEGMHAQKQTQLSTRLKGKQQDCNIKEVGGKRVRIHSGERYVVKVTQQSKLTQLQQIWRMGSIVRVKSQGER